MSVNKNKHLLLLVIPMLENGILKKLVMIVYIRHVNYLGQVQLKDMWYNEIFFSFLQTHLVLRLITKFFNQYVEVQLKNVHL